MATTGNSSNEFFTPEDQRIPTYGYRYLKQVDNTGNIAKDYILLFPETISENVIYVKNDKDFRTVAQALNYLFSLDLDKTTANYTTEEKNKLSGIANGAEVNQNAFSKVVVGSTTIEADSKTDTLTLVAGDNVTLTPDTSNDKVTITAKDTNTWRGIQDNLTSTSATDSLSANQGKKLNDTKLDNAKQLTSEDLDSIKTPGLYFGAGGNTVINKPSGVKHFGLFVYKIASGYIAQELTKETIVYYRYYNSSEWSSWSERKFTDNNTTYTHPTTSGNKHIPSGGSSGQILRWSADGTAVWGNDNNTIYTHPTYTARTGVPTSNQTPAFGDTFQVSQPVSDATGHITAVNNRTITIPDTVATTSTAGLMSATDKIKLDSIIQASTADLEDGVSPLTTGTIYLVYE